MMNPVNISQTLYDPAWQGQLEVFFKNLSWDPVSIKYRQQITYIYMTLYYVCETFARDSLFHKHASSFTR